MRLLDGSSPNTMADIASCWYQDVPDVERFPRAEGNFAFDVVVIGGGIAGVSAAYFLSKAGVKTCLLEAGTIGAGDSSYTTAFATRLLDSVTSTIRGWEASERGISLFKEIISREHIDCDWEDVDSIVFSQKNNTAEFKKKFQALVGIDPALEYFDDEKASAVAGFAVNACYRKKGEGQFHPRKFIIELAKRAHSDRVKIFEKSGVTEITPLGVDMKTVKTAHASIITRFVVVATGLPPKQFFPVVSGMIVPSMTHVIQARFPSGTPIKKALFEDDEEPYHYFRQVNETDIVVGGEDWFLDASRPAQDPYTRLEQWLWEVAGEVKFKVVNKWQGTLYYTRDCLPYVGAFHLYGRNVIFLTGWGGNGMAHGLLAGQITSDLVQKKENNFQMLFSFRYLPDSTYFSA